MSQEAMPDTLPLEFTFPTWNSDKDSWDDYILVVEAAYALYRARCFQRAVAPQTAQHPNPEEEAD